jgi:hypothetical protein
MTEERITLFNLLKSRKRRAATMIATVVDGEGHEHTTTHEIMRTFATTIQSRYMEASVEDECIKIMEKIDGNTLTAEQRDTLEEHDPKDEVRRAIHGGANNKALGSDGISLEFFQDTREEMADH